MLVNMQEVMKDAVENGYAVGAFNVANLESVRAIVQAAEECGKGVIMEFANAAHSPLIPLDEIGPIMVEYAKRASVPVCVHLDHGSSLEECVKAISLGFTSVMFDASAAPYEENVRDTALMVRLAHNVGVSVEAELGHILTSDIGVGEGSADASLSEAYDQIAEDTYTDPNVAEDFVKRTGVDILAIAFGTAHGLYTVEPRLDLDRIKLIREKVSLPLVMHGGSGLSKNEYQEAIKNGIRKINYYTYMSLHAGKAVREAMDKHSTDDNIFFHDVSLIGTQAMKEDLVRVIKIFSLEN